MSLESELEVLLPLDGYSYEAAAGYVVEFLVLRTEKTPARPHGISYALVFRPKDGKPYVRFDNAHAVDRPGGRFVRAMVKLLPSENLKLLHLIATRRPGSVRELAVLVRRKESNLSRTLKKLQEAGIVAFEKGPGRTRAPRLIARRVTLDLDLVGVGSVASIERASIR